MFIFALILGLILACANAREFVKQKPTSTLTHSILNLGKMEINVYLNEKNDNKKSVEDLGGKQDSYESPKSQYEVIHPLRTESNYRSEPVVEECPCISQRPKEALAHSPKEILNKILMNNDLFSFNRDPVNSNLCCSSHEQVQEEFFIEFSPRQGPSQMHMQSIQHPAQLPQFPPKFPFLPFLSETFNKQATMKPKSKGIEIFLVPTKKPSYNLESKKKLYTKPEIQIVGDRKTTMLYDIASAKSSVKKDLNQEKEKREEKTAAESADLLSQPSVESVKTTSAVNNTL